MQLSEIRKKLSEGKSIFDLNLRVAFYARVSTGFSEQLNSLDNQVSFFKDYILKNPNWTLANAYIDEGISGTSVKKRADFLKMIDDSKNDMFDLIITKEISRFARNTIDSIKYTQQLLINNVGVYFLNDNINTFEPDSELRLTIMSSLVQEEVRKISGRVKFGHREAIKKGRVLGNDKIWGYFKNDGKLLICEDEAKIVRIIFNLYISGMGINSICQRLYDMGYKNQNGNKFTYNTIKSIITNPKYKGYYAGQKSEKIDYRHNRRMKFNKSDWVMYPAPEEVVPKIIDEALWDRANMIFTHRSGGNKALGKDTRPNEKTPYSGKIICAQHNASYWRSCYKTSYGTKEIWQCKVYRNQGRCGCDSPHLHTETIDKIAALALERICFNDDDLKNRLLCIYKEVLDSKNHTIELKEVELKTSKIRMQKDKLLDLFMEGIVSKSEFSIRNSELNERLENLNKIKEKILSDVLIGRPNTEKLEKIKMALESIITLHDGTSVQKLAGSVLQEIKVYPNINGTVQVHVSLDGCDASLEHEIMEYKDKKTLYRAQVIKG